MHYRFKLPRYRHDDPAEEVLKGAGYYMPGDRGMKVIAERAFPGTSEGAAGSVRSYREYCAQGRDEGR